VKAKEDGRTRETRSITSAAGAQPLTDGLYNIMFGRAPIGSLDGLVKQWRANGGDAIRSELQQALQLA
jgi:putative aldouronate transport system substrate-binding protein